MFVLVERHELERLRRSVGMVTPQQPVLDRETVLSIIGDLAAAQAELRRLREDLLRLVGTIDR